MVMLLLASSPFVVITRPSGSQCSTGIPAQRYNVEAARGTQHIMIQISLSTGTHHNDTKSEASQESHYKFLK